jgi:hypothetical protein
METVRKCVSCGSDRLARYAAVVAPFLAARIGALRGARAELVWCHGCQLAFFSPRLGEPEMALLYRGYRGPQYQTERQAHEPLYTVELNDSIGKGEAELASRKENFRAILARHAPLETIHGVLDFGGDRGQFIPDELASARCVVYEVSGAEPREGVVGLSDWRAVQEGRYDLILCNHVLEHVPDPNEVISRLDAVAHDRTWFYFEVPAESPFRFDHLGPAKAWLKRWVLRFPAVTNAMHGLLGMPTMHEHVNLFTVEALVAALGRNGLEVAEAREVVLDLGWLRSRVIACLARRAQRAPRTNLRK